MMDWDEDWFRTTLNSIVASLTAMKHSIENYTGSADQMHQLEQLRFEINKKMLPFREVGALDLYSSMKSRVLLRSKRRRYRKRKRERDNAKKAMLSTIVRKRNQDIDRWREQNATILLRQSQEKKIEQARIEQRVAQEKLQSERGHLEEIKLSLLELIALRKHRWKRHGHVFPDEDEAFLCRAHKQYLQDMAASQDDPVHTDSDPHTCGETLLASHEADDNPVQDNGVFFNEPTKDLNQLIAVRRKWDMYLVNRHCGSRIPLHLPLCPKSLHLPLCPKPGPQV